MLCHALVVYVCKLLLLWGHMANGELDLYIHMYNDDDVIQVSYEMSKYKLKIIMGLLYTSLVC